MGLNTRFYWVDESIYQDYINRNSKKELMKKILNSNDEEFPTIGLGKLWYDMFIPLRVLSLKYNSSLDYDTEDGFNSFDSFEDYGGQSFIMPPLDAFFLTDFTTIVLEVLGYKGERFPARFEDAIAKGFGIVGNFLYEKAGLVFTSPLTQHFDQPSLDKALEIVWNEIISYFRTLSKEEIEQRLYTVYLRIPVDEQFLRELFDQYARLLHFVEEHYNWFKPGENPEKQKYLISFTS
jgi:hypothetical protein